MKNAILPLIDSDISRFTFFYQHNEGEFELFSFIKLLCVKTLRYSFVQTYDFKNNINSYLILSIRNNV